MRIIGIDPGYDRLGMAMVEKNGGAEQVVFSACLTSDKKAGLPARYLSLGQELERLIRKYRPDKLAIEKLFFTTNQKTASQVSEVRGFIIYLAAKSSLDVVEYTPLQIKSTITGYGKADKNQVIEMVKRLVKLNDSKKTDDEYDAIAVALTALARLPASEANGNGGQARERF